MSMTACFTFLLQGDLVNENYSASIHETVSDLILQDLLRDVISGTVRRFRERAMKKKPMT
jgi:hypothetical protein